MDDFAPPGLTVTPKSPWRRDFDKARDPYGARNALAAVEEAPRDGQPHVRTDGGWPVLSYIGTVASQVFTANGTYTPTAGMKFAIIECIGGGGGGGGAANAGAGIASSGAGGGAGSHSRKLVTAADIGASK